MFCSLPNWETGHMVRRQFSCHRKQGEFTVQIRCQKIPCILLVVLILTKRFRKWGEFENLLTCFGLTLCSQLLWLLEIGTSIEQRWKQSIVPILVTGLATIWFLEAVSLKGWFLHTCKPFFLSWFRHPRRSHIAIWLRSQ